MGEQLCNSAAHARPNAFPQNATKLIKLTVSHSSHFPSQTVLSLPHVVPVLCLVANVFLVDLSNEV